MTNNVVELLKVTRDTANTLNDLLNQQHSELLEIKQILADYLVFMQEEIKKLQTLQALPDAPLQTKFDALLLAKHSEAWISDPGASLLGKKQ